MEKRIEHYLNQLEIKKRGDETIIVFKDNASDELKDSVRKAHGDRLPDDWIFNKYHSILDDLFGYDIKNADDLEEKRSEVVDGLVDPYTANLTSWLNANVNNVNYLTEALEDHGEGCDGFKILQMAQYAAINEIYSEVVDLLTHSTIESVEI